MNKIKTKTQYYEDGPYEFLYGARRLLPLNEKDEIIVDKINEIVEHLERLDDQEGGDSM